MKRISIVISLLFIFLVKFSLADEGMWLTMYINRLNYADMQKAGLKLTAEEIYSVNHSSLKDAIVVLNGGSCTAEMISGEGLMLTNHHCAYGVIQSSSSVETNYLEKGFWAMKRSDEIPAKGMTASFLVKMEDVTDVVNAALNDKMTDQERQKTIRSVSDSLVKLVDKDSLGYDANVKSMFGGNQFYLFVYNTYRDIRLVSAPPEAIGKFGGDTDNWMWPRHTGDFSMLRIYADKEGKPADYSEDNIPLKPKHHLPVSLKGVKKEDFAMIMGYPGSTSRYLTSYGVRSEIATTHKTRIKLRERRLDIYKADMDKDEAIRLKYASKYAQISNYYKNSIGMVKSLNRLKVIDKKKAEEDQFTAWVNADEARKLKYGEALPLIKDALEKGGELQLAANYVIEAFYYTEAIGLAWRFKSLAELLESEVEKDKQAELEQKINKTTEALRARAAGVFKDYNKPTDKTAFAALLKIYADDIPATYHPKAFGLVNKKYKGDFSKYAEYVYGKTIFADEDKMNNFLDKPSAKVLLNDPVFELASFANDLYFNAIRPENSTVSANLEKGRRLYLAGLMEMQKNRTFYPDANSTMRLSYGNVRDYQARDAVHFDYFTTLDGVMEKEDTSNFEFIVPERLKELYKAKDYGRYGENGQLMVNFITNNDITGGNSGSPVINANGELIGCAFDGNWEAMSGDISFEPELQRTIITDIRYILFIVDKYAGASHLIDEMTLIKN